MLLESCGYRDVSYRYEPVVLPPAHMYVISKASPFLYQQCASQVGESHLLRQVLSH